jgi:LysR family transcriptional regulator, low CO2-responsive transcriptional regulator
MSRDPLPYLETFAQAAELGSFTAAARALGLTQAAVSQRVRALERTLNVSLFRRESGRVFLTEAGQHLYPYSQQIQSLHEDARREITGRKPVLRGELTLAASSIPGEHLLPAVLSAFRRRHPHVHIRASVSDSSAVLAAVEHGQAHLGLVGMKTDNPDVEFRKFACDALVLVVPRRHPWRRRRQVTLADLCRQPLVLREPGSGSRWCLEQALSRAGASPAELQIALELGSNEAIKEAVLRGVGAAVLSRHTIRREVRAGQLHTLKVAGLCLKRDIYVVWDRRRALPIAARLFLDALDPAPSQP